MKSIDFQIPGDTRINASSGHSALIHLALINVVCKLS